jgi:8-oxo-dGTP pyrophosphatase MutT (NUDIX family)
MSEKSSKTIRAAGGIISGVGSNSGKIAVVRRRRYSGEVGLPKGKLNEGETEAEAALREVEEETGLRAILRQRIGSTQYSVDGKPKTVTYFMMDAPDDAVARPHDSREIHAVEWLTPVEAVAALTHDDDRTLVMRVFDIGKEPT